MLFVVGIGLLVSKVVATGEREGGQWPVSMVRQLTRLAFHLVYRPFLVLRTVTMGEREGLLLPNAV